MKFVLGFAVGFGLSLIFAPARGEVTRRRLAEVARELMRMPREKAEHAADFAEENAGEIGGKIGGRAAESAVEAVKNDLLGQNQSA